MRLCAQHVAAVVEHAQVVLRAQAEGAEGGEHAGERGGEEIPGVVPTHFVDLQGTEGGGRKFRHGINEFYKGHR